MWSIAVTTIMSCILMIALSLSTIEISAKQVAQQEESVNEILRHQRAVISWVARCRLALNDGSEPPTECRDGPGADGQSSSCVGWTPVDWNKQSNLDDNLTCRGVISASMGGKTIWHPGDSVQSIPPAIYFVWTEGASVQNDLAKRTMGSVLNGIVSSTKVLKPAFPTDALAPDIGWRIPADIAQINSGDHVVVAMAPYIFPGTSP